MNSRLHPLSHVFLYKNLTLYSTLSAVLIMPNMTVNMCVNKQEVYFLFIFTGSKKSTLLKSLSL